MNDDFYFTLTKRVGFSTVNFFFKEYLAKKMHLILKLIFFLFDGIKMKFNDFDSMSLLNFTPIKQIIFQTVIFPPG